MLLTREEPNKKSPRFKRPDVTCANKSRHDENTEAQSTNNLGEDGAHG